MKREFKIITGCLTYGTTDLELKNICDNPKCVNCNLMNEAILEEIKKWKL